MPAGTQWRATRKAPAGRRAPQSRRRTDWTRASAGGESMRPKQGKGWGRWPPVARVAAGGRLWAPRPEWTMARARSGRLGRSISLHIGRCPISVRIPDVDVIDQ